MNIERLRLNLPASSGVSASRLAIYIGDELAKMPPTPSESIDQVSIPKVSIPRGASERDVAQRIARAIHASVNGQRNTAP